MHTRWHHMHVGAIQYACDEHCATSTQSERTRMAMEEQRAWTLSGGRAKGLHVIRHSIRSASSEGEEEEVVVIMGSIPRALHMSITWSCHTCAHVHK